MDARRCAHYIAPQMNVLLLLSALLSAITGVNVGGARVPVAAEQVAQAGRIVAAAVAFPAAAVRPVQAVDLLRPRLAVAPLVRLPVPAIPAFASRRRE